MAGKLVDGDGIIAIKNWVEANLVNYLPLSAGSGKALTNDLYVKSVIRTASGSGDLVLKTEGGDAVSIDSNANLEIKANGTYIASLNTTLLSAGRTFSFPDKDGTFALLSDISNVYNYKGSASVDQFNGTASSGNINYSSIATGDVYNVTDSGTVTHNNVSISVIAGDNLAWDGSNWDKLAGTIDLSGYLPLSAGSTKALTGDLYVDSIIRTASGSGDLVLKTEGGDAVSIDSAADLEIKANGTYIASINTTALSAGRSYSLPDKGGTFALLSDINGYLPLSAGSSYPLTGDLYVKSVVRTASGSGDLVLKTEGGDAVSIQSAAAIEIIAGNANNYIATISNSTFSQSRTFSLPNKDGTFALTSDIAVYTGSEVTQILNSGVLPA